MLFPLVSVTRLYWCDIRANKVTWTDCYKTAKYHAHISYQSRICWGASTVLMAFWSRWGSRTQNRIISSPNAEHLRVLMSYGHTLTEKSSSLEHPQQCRPPGKQPGVWAPTPHPGADWAPKPLSMGGTRLPGPSPLTLCGRMESAVVVWPLARSRSLVLNLPTLHFSPLRRAWCLPHSPWSGLTETVQAKAFGNCSGSYREHVTVTIHLGYLVPFQDVFSVYM